MSAGKERPGASGREICGSRQKQTAKMGQLARRARLARTGACRSMSQLGNAASDWKKENRADFFPSDLLGQAAKGGLFIPKPQLVTEVISDVVRESVRELCACYARCSIESLTDRPHQAPLSVASLTILEMLRGRRFQVLASHRLPPVRIYHDHTHTHTPPTIGWQQPQARVVASAVPGPGKSSQRSRCTLPRIATPVPMKHATSQVEATRHGASRLGVC